MAIWWPCVGHFWVVPMSSKPCTRTSRTWCHVLFLSKLKSRFPWPNLEYLGISYQFHSVAIKIICFSLWNTMNGLEVKKNIKPRFDVEPGASFRAPGWLIGDGQVKNTCLVARGKHYGIWCYGKLKWLPCDFGESRRLPVISFQIYRSCSRSTFVTSQALPSVCHLTPKLLYTICCSCG